MLLVGFLLLLLKVCVYLNVENVGILCFILVKIDVGFVLFVIVLSLL